MTTPKLNRIFTVSGSSTQSVEDHVRWGANDRADDAFVLMSAAGGWYADKLVARGYAWPDSGALASELVAFNPYQIGIQNPTVNADGSHQIDIPMLRDTLRNMLDRAHWMRVRTPESGDSYIQFNVIVVTVFVDSPMATVLEVENPVLVGDDFTLGPQTYTQFQFENHTHQVSETVVSDKRTWGELTERGSQVGFLDITTGDPTTTASEETGTALVRYENSLAVGEMLTDDLGRVWTVDGSRTLQDRRYLEYSLTRLVA